MTGSQSLCFDSLLTTFALPLTWFEDNRTQSRPKSPAGKDAQFQSKEERNVPKVARNGDIELDHPGSDVREACRAGSHGIALDECFDDKCLIEL